MSGFLKLSALCAFVIASSALPTSAGEEKEAREGGLTGTGIVGEIVKLGSIIVNTQRITFAPDMQVSSAAGPKPASALRPGQTVAVAVQRDGDHWAADAITQVHPIVGPVSEVHPDALVVMGARILKDARAPEVAVGDWIAVSGFWNRETVIATAIEVVPPQAQASVQGSYASAPEDTPSWKLGAVTMNGPRPEHATEGQILRVYGTAQRDGLEVRDMRLGVFDAPKALVLAEGYFSVVSVTGHYTVAGSGLSSYTEQRGDVMTQDKVRICGVDGTIVKPDAVLSAETRAQLRVLGCPTP
ncbi:hypothetical protein J7400_14855 [Shimia sp. R9_2]|uniref:DUF5666 domain-containing protein n=1 Tax=Shimia sp. R9_2 TaxID=2821112 RepID=UPI001ADB96D7|nr:DUF5666 domain-containing protein [Shimia sp. R9_2]MBO9397965.1 hypothetical protein [Shimia sp. R9_2]